MHSEGNFHEFVYQGYECRIIRPYPISHLCGYVKVEKGHPCFGMHRDKVPISDEDIHWGITFSSNMGIAGTWWIGFDCCHLGDLSPSDVLTYNRKNDHEVYRTVNFVKKECKKLVRKLKKIEKLD